MAIRRSRRRSGRRRLQSSGGVVAYRGAVSVGAQALNRRTRSRNKTVAAKNSRVSKVLGKRRGNGAIRMRPVKRMKAKSLRLKCSDYDVRKVAYGRKRIVSKSQLMQIAVPRRILRFQNVNAFQDPTRETATAGQVAGAFAMYYDPNSVAVAAPNPGASTFPVVLMDLTSTIQNSVPDFLYKVSISGTGWPVLGAYPGRDSGGALVTTLNIESTNCATGTPGAARQYVQPAWHSVNLVLYGARKQPTEFEVLLVRPKEERYDPIYANSQYTLGTNTLTGYSDGPAADVYAAWWADFVRPMVANPLLRSGARASGSVSKQPFNVLKRWKVGIPCAMSTESDGNPNSRILKMFIRDGRILDYMWPGADESYDVTRTDRDDNIFSTTSWYRVEGNIGGEYDMRPRPRARTYLIMRCLNYVAKAAASVDVDTTPSFDIVYRRKEYLGESRG